MALFYNYSTEDFTCSWDGTPYTFKAGEIYNKTIEDTFGRVLVLEPGITETFAINLAMREMRKAGLDERLCQREIGVFEDYITRAVSMPEIEVVEEEDEEEPVVKPAPKKRGRKKKVVEEAVNEEII